MPGNAATKRLFAALCALVLLVVACGQTKTPSPSVIEVRSSFPTTKLDPGQLFDVVVTMTNVSDYNARLTEMRLPAPFFQAMRYIGSNPGLTVNQASTGEGVIDLDQVIAPGGVETITFRFAAQSAGKVDGLGLVVTDGGRYQFTMSAEVTGSNPVGWDPGIAPTEIPADLGPIPYQAVVQIKAVVTANGRDQIGWTGSGTIISKDGLILTNAHVVLSDRFYEVKNLIISLTLRQDSPPVDTYYAGVLQVDAAMDIALIKPRTDMQGNPVNYATMNLPVVPLGDSDQLSLGDSIVILGYPGIGGETITLTRGEVSGFTSEEPYGNRAFIKTSATIAGGNSGGLAVNERGELIGVPSQVGSGDVNDNIVDCRPLADTNRDGYINDSDTCVPTGGFINALRPVKLTMPMIEAARQGQVAIEAAPAQQEDYDEAAGQIVFQDDFSSDQSGWDIATSENGSTNYENGEFVISVFSPNYLIWADVDYVYEDVMLSVNARVLQAAGQSDFGFVCGETDNQHFTVLEITEDGYFSFWKQVGDNVETLIDWTYSPEVASGGPYQLQALCGKSGLMLGVNGVKLGEYVDPAFTPGIVGLIGGTFEQPGFKVAFDNFVVMIP